MHHILTLMAATCTSVEQQQKPSTMYMNEYNDT